MDDNRCDNYIDLTGTLEIDRENACLIFKIQIYNNLYSNSF